MPDIDIDKIDALLDELQRHIKELSTVVFGENDSLLKRVIETQLQNSVDCRKSLREIAFPQ